MPRFSHLDHRLDNQIVNKKDLRFQSQDAAEEFATSQYLTDFIPRSVIEEVPGLFMIEECPGRVSGYGIMSPKEVFYIDYSVGEG